MQHTFTEAAFILKVGIVVILLLFLINSILLLGNYPIMLFFSSEKDVLSILMMRMSCSPPRPALLVQTVSWKMGTEVPIFTKYVDPSMTDGY